LVEALVSIFIPFYDEIKFLVILFLIMTHASIQTQQLGPGNTPVYIFNLLPETEEAVQEREEVEEWRQYPPFPLAYPPTPLVATPSRLPDNAASTIHTPQLSPDAVILSDISEDLPQQDFGESLLLPRKPLNPGLVDGLSNDYYNPGAQSNCFDNIIDNINSGTDEDLHVL
jgi:hypothetical protein